MIFFVLLSFHVSLSLGACTANLTECISTCDQGVVSCTAQLVSDFCKTTAVCAGQTTVPTTVPSTSSPTTQRETTTVVTVAPQVTTTTTTKAKPATTPPLVDCSDNAKAICAYVCEMESNVKVCECVESFWPKNVECENERACTKEDLEHYSCRGGHCQGSSRCVCRKDGFNRQFCEPPKECGHISMSYRTDCLACTEFPGDCAVAESTMCNGDNDCGTERLCVDTGDGPAITSAYCSANFETYKPIPFNCDEVTVDDRASCDLCQQVGGGDINESGKCVVSRVALGSSGFKCVGKNVVDEQLVAFTSIIECMDHFGAYQTTASTVALHWTAMAAALWMLFQQ